MALDVNRSMVSLIEIARSLSKSTMQGEDSLAVQYLRFGVSSSVARLDDKHQLNESSYNIAERVSWYGFLRTFARLNRAI